MKLLYGTTNAGKLQTARKWIRDLDIELLSLHDMEQVHLDIDESGKTPLENARLKAEAYWQKFGVPVFSCDSGLYFDGLPEELQPGLHVRRVDGRELTDEEMITYYSGLAVRYAPLRGRYINAISLIVDDAKRYESMDESLWGSWFGIVSEPHKTRTPGFPLDSLSIHLKSGKYYHDRTGQEDNKVDRGFRQFFTKVMRELQAVPWCTELNRK